jgi:hypothetical protein
MTHQSIKEIEKEIKELKKEHCDTCDNTYGGKCPTCKPEFDKLRAKLQQANDDRKEFLEVIDNFWEQGKKIRVDITKTGKNTSKGVCIREFSYEQWEELRKVMGK